MCVTKNKNNEILIAFTKDFSYLNQRKKSLSITTSYLNVEINQIYFSYRRSTYISKYYQTKKHILLYIQAIYFFSNFCLLSVIKHFQIYNTPKLLIYFSLIKKIEKLAKL